MYKKKVWNPREKNLDSKRGENMDLDYTKFSVEQLEQMLKAYKDKLASMILNPKITEVIAEVEVLEFIIKSRKENGQEDAELN